MSVMSLIVAAVVRLSKGPYSIYVALWEGRRKYVCYLGKKKMGFIIDRVIVTLRPSHPNFHRDSWLIP